MLMVTTIQKIKEILLRSYNWNLEDDRIIIVCVWKSGKVIKGGEALA